MNADYLNFANTRTESTERRNRFVNKYSVKEIGTFDHGPGQWSGIRVGVFLLRDEHEEQIGEYERNYFSLFNSFHPFHLNGQDLALYSTDYTATRIMELPSCRDLGGEERDDLGFCPVEYFVPTYVDQEFTTESDNKAIEPLSVRRSRLNNPLPTSLEETITEHRYENLVSGQQCTDRTSVKNISPVTYYPFGFVSGCVWGDDSTLKIQYLDLKDAARGVLRREERFGHIMLPEDLDLRKAIDMSDYAYDLSDPESFTIKITHSQEFDVATGKVVD